MPEREGTKGSNLKIAISGKSGCGNSTVSRLLAEKINGRLVNFTFRNLAEENNLTLNEVLKLAEGDDKWDTEVDTRQVELARQPGTCVLGSRLAIWMLPEADLKVYLKAGGRVRAERIARREGGGLDEVYDFTEKRDNKDSARYRRLYKIDNDDTGAAHLVIDTENVSPEEIVEKIIQELRSRELSFAADVERP